MVPNIHIFHHIVRDIARTRRNPASHWCFLDKSNIGMVKKIARNCHASTLSKRAMECLVLFFAFTAEGRTVAARAEEDAEI